MPEENEVLEERPVEDEPKSDDEGTLEEAAESVQDPENE